MIRYCLVLMLAGLLFGPLAGCGKKGPPERPGAESEQDETETYRRPH